MDDLMPAGSSPWPAPSFTKPDRVSSRTCKKMGACIRFREGGGGEMQEKRRGGAGMRTTALLDLGRVEARVGHLLTLEPALRQGPGQRSP